MKTERSPASQNKFFYAIASMLLLVAAFIFLFRFFMTPELIYPVRVDSLYVTYQAMRNSENSPRDLEDKLQHIPFNPASLGIPYEDFNITTPDGLLLKGWFVSAGEKEQITLLIIHDLSQSKINYLNMLKQMHDRGLNVCVVDMRAHGNSEGEEFSPGILAVSDVRTIIDSLFKKPGTDHLAIFGSGLGSAIAIQGASFDERPDVLILQSPFSSFLNYVSDYSKRKWGGMGFLFKGILERELESRMQYDLAELDLSQLIKNVKKPTMIIVGSSDQVIPPMSTYAVFDSSGAREKKLYLVRNAKHENIEQVEGEEYYNCIAEFIINSVPRKLKDTRFKKLAVQ